MNKWICKNEMNWYDLWTDNRIDGDGAHLLYDSLRYNSTLTELNLDEDCKQMRQYMNDNMNVEETLSKQMNQRDLTHH